MNRTRLFTILLACLFAPLALGQTARFGLVTVSHPTVTGVGPSTSSNLLATVDVRKQDCVMLQLEYELSDSGTDKTTLTYGYSLDGTAPTAFTYTALATNTGTTKVVQPITLDCSGAGFLHLISIANGDASGNLTNIVIKYGVKRAT